MSPEPAVLRDVLAFGELKSSELRCGQFGIHPLHAKHWNAAEYRWFQLTFTVLCSIHRSQSEATTITLRHLARHSRVGDELPADYK